MKHETYNSNIWLNYIFNPMARAEEHYERKRYLRCRLEVRRVRQMRRQRLNRASGQQAV